MLITKNVMLRNVKEEIRLRNFGFDHQPVESMVQSQWQSRPLSTLYLLYRGAFAAVVTYTVFASFFDHIHKHKFGLYFIYLTRWSIMLNMIVGLYSAILVTMWHYSSNFKEDVSQTEKMPAKFKLYWALHNIALTIAVVITIVYWALIFHGTTPLDHVNIMSHVGNSVMMFIDLWVVGHPHRIYHFIQPVCFGIGYGLFTYIYYVCGGVNIDGDSFIYKVLTWYSPQKTLTTICFTMILCIVVHLILFMIHVLRAAIQRRCRPTIYTLPTTSPKSNVSLADPMHVTAMPIEKGLENPGFE